MRLTLIALYCALSVAVMLLGGCAKQKPIPSAAETRAVVMETTVPKAHPAELTPQQELEVLILDFTAAYFSGDTSAIRDFLAEDFEGTVEGYPGDAAQAEKAPMPDLGIWVEDMEAGKTISPSIPFRESPEVDSYTYLTIELVKTQEGLRVLSYGLEK